MLFTVTKWGRNKGPAGNQSGADPRLSSVFCNKFITGSTLPKEMDLCLGMKCISTPRKNHTGRALLMKDNELKKKEQGAFDYRSLEGIAAVRLNDKCATLLGNAVGVQSTTEVKRRDKDTKAKGGVPCPGVINNLQ